MARKPTRTNLSVMAQLCNLIPGFLVSKIAREYGVDKKARTFSPWPHLVALLYGQFTHALSLNDVSDAKELETCVQGGELRDVQGRQHRGHPQPDTPDPRGDDQHGERGRDGGIE